MSILEVAISITVMGMIGIVIGSSFSAIQATHQLGDDMVDARRLVSLQLALFDEAFGPVHQYPPAIATGPSTNNPADAFHWGISSFTPASTRYLPTEVQRSGVNFPNLWAPGLTPYTISITGNPASFSDVNAFFTTTPSRATVADLPQVNNLTMFTTATTVSPSPWHVWSELQTEERQRLVDREINVDLYLARLDTVDTQIGTGLALEVSPYRYHEGTTTLWWIAQIDVRRSNQILQTVYRIGP